MSAVLFVGAALFSPAPISLRRAEGPFPHPWPSTPGAEAAPEPACSAQWDLESADL